MTATDDTAGAGRKSRIKAPIEFFGGLFLLGLAALGFYGAIDLPGGELSRMGPGMMPRIASAAIAIFGAALIAESFITEGNAPERWHWRGIVFVFGGVLVFSLTIRDFGLAVAGPLSVIISAFGDRETRLVEIIPFAVIMTIGGALLFKWLLGLPIPLMPYLLGY
ncbi:MULTISPECIES: tripartite tricarboxylate transporter TctB family protein [Rhodomicrobium]|uniref:tripartite tricarboxylate transporter TctB family protein n=1 Tax=Rhodomicrobium TaxID=1068 RepID=UPI000B4ABC41|nr:MULTISPECIES: tripartite tricarboxylate transporter TctB family protein [Rhodomicrobium]